MTAATNNPAKAQRPKDNADLKKHILEELRKPGKSMNGLSRIDYIVRVETFIVET